jgi:hypothetical protein
MPPFLEFFVITFTMLGAFAMVFLLMFLLALVLAPIERGLSDMIWSHQHPSAPLPGKGSFKDFSKKH